MTTTGKFVITYTGNGIVRLPRAGIFQTGTRAVVDETIARIATAHGCFAVVSLDAPLPVPVQEAAPAPAPPPIEAPRRPTRRSQAIRVVDQGAPLRSAPHSAEPSGAPHPTGRPR